MASSRRGLVVVSLIIALGCKSDQSQKLVGKWTTGTGDTRMEWEFAGDGKFALSSYVRHQAMWQTTLGTFTTSGDTINFTYADMRFKTDDPKMQPMADTVLRMAKQKMLNVFIKNDSVDKLTWKSTDQFIMTDSKGKGETFDRVKA